MGRERVFLFLPLRFLEDVRRCRPGWTGEPRRRWMLLVPGEYSQASIPMGQARLLYRTPSTVRRTYPINQTHGVLAVFRRRFKIPNRSRPEAMTSHHSLMRAFRAIALLRSQSGIGLTGTPMAAGGV